MKKKNIPHDIPFAWNFKLYFNLNFFEIFLQWRGLSDTDKAHYEAKAKKMNEENAIKAAEEKKLEEQ